MANTTDEAFTINSCVTEGDGRVPIDRRRQPGIDISEQVSNNLGSAERDAVEPARRCHSRRPLPAANDTMTLAIEPTPGKAEQALRQEDDHDDEDHAERDEIGELIAENAR